MPQRLTEHWAGRVMERIGMKKMLLVLYAVWFVIGLATVSPSAILGSAGAIQPSGQRCGCTFGPFFGLRRSDAALFACVRAQPSVVCDQPQCSRGIDADDIRCQ